MSVSSSPFSRRSMASCCWCGVGLKGRLLCPRAFARPRSSPQPPVAPIIRDYAKRREEFGECCASNGTPAVPFCSRRRDLRTNPAAAVGSVVKAGRRHPPGRRGFSCRMVGHPARRRILPSAGCASGGSLFLCGSCAPCSARSTPSRSPPTQNSANSTSTAAVVELAA